jgi:hypothetical protein
MSTNPKTKQPRLPWTNLNAAILLCVGCSVVANLLLMIGSNNVNNINHGKNATTQLDPQLMELPPLVIFYHIFLPPENDEAKRAKDIVKEQLLDLGHGLSKSPNSPAATLYYLTEGQGIDDDFIRRICGRLHKHIGSCTTLQNIESGFEEFTLQQLFEHCQEHEDHRVIYLHTKGSYNVGERQDYWLRHMTQAVVSPECIVRAATEQCDLCGLLFLAQPSYHFPGNIFNAKCSYIRQLIPPIEFGGRMDNLFGTAKGLIENGTFTTKGPGWGLEPWNMGTERFAMGHWPGSHPSLEGVCYLAKRREREYWEDLPVEAREPDDWEFQTFPREAVWCPTPGVELDYCTLDSMERKKVYHLLPGRIFKWDFLYGEVPAPSSWTWYAYPDGQFWRDQVTIHGSKAFAVMAAVTNDFNDLWYGRGISAIKNSKTVKASLVITFCSGDLHWLKNYTDDFVFDRTFVAVKCGIQPDRDALPENATLVPLPNVGGCDHTMSFWMSEVAPTLPRAYDSDEVVVFLKDSLIHPAWINIRDFKTTLEIATSDQDFGCVLELPPGFSFFANLKVLRKFKRNKYLRQSERAPIQGADPFISFKSPYKNLGDWHRGLGIIFPGPYVPVCYGGMFIVKRSRIDEVPMEVLRNLTTSLARGNNIEEGHFAERTWAALFIDNLSVAKQVSLQERTRSIGTGSVLGTLRF